MSRTESSIYGDTIIVGQKLLAPVGFQLSSVANRTLVPTTGSVAYDSNSEQLFVGTSDEWVLTGTTGPTGSVGPVGPLGPTGPTNTNSTFPTGVVVQVGSTPGVNYVFNRYAERNYGAVTWTGAFNRVGTLAVALIGEIIFLRIGYLINTGSANAILTCSTVLDVDFWPLPAGQGNSIPIFDAGVFNTGYLNVSIGGIITAGAADTAASNIPAAFNATGSNAGISECVVAISRTI